MKTEKETKQIIMNGEKGKERRNREKGHEVRRREEYIL